MAGCSAIILALQISLKEGRYENPYQNLRYHPPRGCPCRRRSGRGCRRAGVLRKSKRAVTSVQAKEIVAVLPPFVSVVALFVNEQSDVIREILHQVPIDVIQFHGDEDDDFCRQFDRPYLKAVRVQSAADIQTACAVPQRARCCSTLTIRPNTAARAEFLIGRCCAAISANRGFWRAG